MTDPYDSAYDPAAGAGALLIATLIWLVIAGGMYVWYAWALSKVFATLGAPAWKAWVPIVNEAEIFARGGVPSWQVVFYYLPVVNLYALYLRWVATGRINAFFGKGSGFTVLAILVAPVWATLLASAKAPAAVALSDRISPASQVRSGAATPSSASPASATSSTATASVAASGTAPAVTAAPAAAASPTSPPPTSGSAAPGPVAPAPPASGAPAGAPYAVKPAPHGANPMPSTAPPSPVPPGFAPDAPLAAAKVSPPAVPVPPATPEPPAPEAAAAPPIPPIPPAPTAAQAPAAEVPPAPAPEARDSSTPVVPVVVHNPWAPRDDSPAPEPKATPAVAAPPIAVPIVAPTTPPPVTPPPVTPPVVTPPVAAPAVKTPVEIPAVPFADEDDDDGETVVVDRRPKVSWFLTIDGGERLPLKAPHVLLGRRPTSAEKDTQALPIPDSTRTLSKVHARLDLANGAWTITDLDSTNGVLLVAQDGTETLVEPGRATAVDGRFLLGKVALEIEFEGPRA